MLELRNLHKDATQHIITLSHLFLRIILLLLDFSQIVNEAWDIRRQMSIFLVYSISRKHVWLPCQMVLLKTNSYKQPYILSMYILKAAACFHRQKCANTASQFVIVESTINMPFKSCCVVKQFCYTFSVNKGFRSSLFVPGLQIKKFKVTLQFSSFVFL